MAAPRCNAGTYEVGAATEGRPYNHEVVSEAQQYFSRSSKRSKIVHGTFFERLACNSRRSFLLTELVVISVAPGNGSRYNEGVWTLTPFDYKMIEGIGLILAGLLLTIFSGPIARFHIAMNKRLLGVELPFAWSRAGGVIVGALVSFSGLLKVLGLPPI